MVVVGWYLCVRALKIVSLGVEGDFLYVALAFNRRNKDSVQEVSDADILYRSC